MKSKKSSGASRRKRASSSESSYGIVAASAFGACIGMIAATALLLICSLVCISSDDPDKLITPLSLLSSVAVYFLAGFAAVRKRRAAIPCGLLSGGIITAVFFIISLFLSKALSWGLSIPVALLIRLSFVAVSILCALLGTNVAVKKRRK